MFQTIAVVVFLAVWVWAYAGRGLGAWFSFDDLMNLYAASEKPLGLLLRQNVLFASGVPRVFADLVNRVLWEVFGFQPAAFRAVCFALLLGNLALASVLMRRLAGCGVVAMLGALLFSYHSYLSDLYMSSGTIYELLCFLFYFSALLWYLTMRAAGRVPGWGQTLLLGLLAVLAMNSKEMAVSLPVMLAATEWLYGDRRHWRTTLVCGAVCALIMLRILASPAVAGNVAYRPELTLAVYLDRCMIYQRLLLYRNDVWTMTHTCVLCAAMAVIPFLVRRKEVWWAFALIVGGMLPMMFVPQRSMYALYIPFLGFCLFAAALAGRAVRVAWPVGWVGPALAVATVALWLMPLHEYMDGWTYRWYDTMEQELIQPGKAVQRGLPRLAPESKVLFLEDPFQAPPEDTTTLFYLVRMISDDHTIGVDRAKGMTDAPIDWGQYSAVFRLTQTELVRVK
jgi:hypothetical protein